MRGKMICKQCKEENILLCEICGFPIDSTGQHHRAPVKEKTNIGGRPELWYLEEEINFGGTD